MTVLSRQAGLLTAAEFFRFFLKSLVGIALARLITPKELGTYRQLFLIYSTFSTLMLLGIPQSLLYFLPKAADAKTQKNIITRTMGLVSLLALLFALAILLFRHEVAYRFNNPQIGSLLLVFAIYPIFMFTTQLYNSVMLGLKQPKSTAIFTLFSIICDFVLIMGVALLWRNLTFIVWAVVFSAFLQWLYARIKLGKINSVFDPAVYTGFKEQLHYAVPLGLSSIIGMLSVQLDKFMISGFFTPEQFAVFSIGAMELPLVGILSNSVNSILLPNLDANNISTMSELYKGAVRKNALIMFPFTLLFFIYAKPMMVFLYGTIYADAALYFRIYLLVLPLRVATYGIIFQAFGKTRIIMVIAIFTLVVNTILNYIMIHIWGMQGAAIATVVVTWLAVIIYLIWMKIDLHLQLSSFFPIPGIIRTTMVTILAGLSVIPVFFYTSSWLARVFCGVPLVSLLYLLLGRLAGVILDCDIAFIRGLVIDFKDRVKL